MKGQVNKKILLLLCACVVLTACVGKRGLSKIESGSEFKDNCVFGLETGSKEKKETVNELEKFFKRTGIQPYVIFFGDVNSAGSLVDLREYAQRWVNTNISEENWVVVACFEDTDGNGFIGECPMDPIFTAQVFTLSDIKSGDIESEAILNTLDSFIDKNSGKAETHEKIITTSLNDTADKLFKEVK